jgi:cation diffusion facilitator family transporter
MKEKLKTIFAGAEAAEKSDFERTAVRVSAVGIIGNAILSLLKLLAGIVAHSGAMISDAVHSASDVLASVIVIIGVKLAAKEADREHPYGHERFECVAAIILAVVLVVTGVLIGKSAVEEITAGSGEMPVPGLLALIAAVVSIVVKEAMYWYTRHYAIKIDSQALRANAWHHRSDALSSVGALIGIAGARLGLPILEPIASIVICVFIFKAAYDIFRDAVSKMVDHSCSAEVEQELRDCACAQPQVRGVDKLRTREFGNRIYVDIEILVDGSLSLTASHEIAECVHDAIEQRFEKVKHIMVHVNPAEVQAAGKEDKR